MEAIQFSPGGRHAPDIFRLWFSPSGRRLMVLGGHSGGANRLWIWDVAGRRPVARRRVVTDSEHDNCFPFPAFDRSLRFMVLGGRVEDRRTGRRIELEYLEFERTISPDGRAVFALAGDGRVDRFDLSWGFEGASTTLRPDGSRSLAWAGKEYARDLAVSPAGDLLVVLTSDGLKLLPFRTADGEALPPVALPVYRTDGVRMMMEPYGRLLFAPDGRAVAVAGDGVCLVAPLGGRPATTLDERHFADLAFTPDGTRLVGVRPDGVAVVWDASDGSAVSSHDFQAEARGLRAVAVAPDGRTALAGGFLGRLVRWEI